MVRESPHRPLAKCHVLFIGNSIPEETGRGLEAIQQPLMTCYPTHNSNQVEGIDSWLTIYTSGIQLQMAGSKGTNPPLIWFPIQNLYVVAAVKCVNYVNNMTGEIQDTQFVELADSAAQVSSHPPLFSFIVRKTDGRKVLQCYSFLTRDEAPAVAMVDAAKYAFRCKSGWANSPPPIQVIQKELVVDENQSDSDDHDGLNSDVAQLINVDMPEPNGAVNGGINSADNNSQNISDMESPPLRNQNLANSVPFLPKSLVKKYTLTYNKKRPTTRPAIPIMVPHPGPPYGTMPVKIRAPLPPHPSVRHKYLTMKSAVSGYRPIPANFIVEPPPVIREKIIREPVFIERPPPPPQIITQVKEVPVPVLVDRETLRGMPMPPEGTWREWGPPPAEWEHEWGSPRGRYGPPPGEWRPSHRAYPRREPLIIPAEQYAPYDAVPNYKPHKDSKYKDKSHGKSSHHKTSSARPAYFVGDQHWGDDTKRGQHKKGLPRHRSRRYSSSDSSLDEEIGKHYSPHWRLQSDGYRMSNTGNGGVEITELSSPDESKPNDRSAKSKKKEYVISHPDYPNDEVLGPKKSNGGQYQWKKSKKGKHKKTKDNTDGNAISNTNQPSEKDSRFSRKKEDFQVENQNGQQYFFKDSKAAKPPRNWFQADKEFMNEKAFSSSLAAHSLPDDDQEATTTNAYAINEQNFTTTMYDRQIPTGDIPPPPPLPPDAALNVQTGGADLY